MRPLHQRQRRLALRHMGASAIILTATASVPLLQCSSSVPRPPPAAERVAQTSQAVTHTSGVGSSALPVTYSQVAVEAPWRPTTAARCE